MTSAVSGAATASRQRAGRSLAPDQGAGILWLAGAVDIGAVLDGHKVDALVLVVDAVDHPVISAPGAMQSLEPELQRLADAVRIRRQRPVAELNHRRRYVLCPPPAASSARPSRISASRSSLSRMSSVSSSDSRSATLITTAAGRPCLVMTTRPCSRSSTCSPPPVFCRTARRYHPHGVSGCNQ